jgi:hypothetical protein
MRRPANKLRVYLGSYWLWVFLYHFIRVSLTTAQHFPVNVVPNGAVDSPPTYPVDTPGVVNVVVAHDGLSAVVFGVTAGTCTITPQVLAGGKTVVGAPIQVTVTVPVVFATHLDVTVGAVVDNEVTFHPGTALEK